MPKLTLTKNSEKLVEALYGEGVKKAPAWNELEKHLDLEKIEAVVTAAVKQHEKEQADAKAAQLAKYTETFCNELKGVLPDGAIIRVTDWYHKGGLLDEGWAEYYYGPRHDVRSEIDCEWEFTLGIDLAHGDKEYSLEINMSVYQEIDVGDDKVYLDGNKRSFDLSEDLTDIIPKSKLKAALVALFTTYVEEPMRGHLLDKLDGKLEDTMVDFGPCDEPSLSYVKLDQGEYAFTKMDTIHGPAEAWIDRLGLSHRDNDMPAVIYGSGRLEWWQHGKYHRDHGPAIINDDGSEEYWKKGKFVRQTSLTKSASKQA